MNTAHVLLLCGLPGSGKSTLAGALKETKDFERIVHIEYDSVARDIQKQTSATGHVEIFNDESLEAWRQSRKVSLERLDEELTNHLKNDNTRLLVIMDDNFHLRSMRKDVYRTCQSHANRCLFFCIAWMDTPVDQCLERNRQRNPRIPDHVINSMSLEPPDPQKAPWEQGSIRLQACNDPLLVLQLIQEKSQLVVPPPPSVDPELIERERQTTRESVLHQYDGYLRSWVGAVAHIRRSDTGNANQARKDILQKLRKREDTVDPTLVMEWFLEELGWTEEETFQLKTAMPSILKRE